MRKIEISRDQADLLVDMLEATGDPWLALPLADVLRAEFGMDAAPTYKGIRLVFDKSFGPVRDQPTDRQADQNWVENQWSQNLSAAGGGSNG